MAGTMTEREIASMAAPIAYEQPTINSAWKAFVDHLPTIVMVLVTTMVIGTIGFIVYLIAALSVAGITVSAVSDPDTVLVLTKGMPALAGRLANLPFAVLGNFFAVLYVAVPAMYYETGDVIGPGMAFQKLLKRPLRILLAGLLFTVAGAIGFVLCVLPGIAICLVSPVYVNRIFNSDEGIVDAFLNAFQAVYRSERGWTFVGIELLTGLCVLAFTVCTCFVGGLVAGPMAGFFIMNSAYRQGVLR
jgi:hypothetical protein